MRRRSVHCGSSVVLLMSLGGAAWAADAPPPATAPAPAPTAAPDTAGGAHTHDGFFLRLGLDLGPLIMKQKIEAGGATGPETKFSGLQDGFDLLIGGSPMPGLAIGGTLLMNTASKPKAETGGVSVKLDGTTYFAGFGAFGDYYPNPHEGLHILGMLGYAVVDYVNANGQSGGNDPTGAMFGLGVGYDFWVGDEWSIGPIGRVLFSSLSSDSNGSTAKITYIYPSIGIGFTLH